MRKRIPVAAQAKDLSVCYAYVNLMWMWTPYTRMRLSFVSLEDHNALHPHVTRYGFRRPIN